MSDWDKKYIIIVFLFCLFLVTVRLGHWGPIGVSKGDDVLCARLALTNGDKLFLVAHRTGETLDAYHVFLYKFDREGKAQRFTLGDEDSFWWGSSLAVNRASGQIEIRAFWQLVALYNPVQGGVTFAANGFSPPSPTIFNRGVFDRILDLSE